MEARLTQENQFHGGALCVDDELNGPESDSPTAAGAAWRRQGKRPYIDINAGAVSPRDPVTMLQMQDMPQAPRAWASRAMKNPWQ